jgi:hypothetical protein
MADWPELDELKQVLDITSEEWDGDGDDTRLTRLLASAIDQVGIDRGLGPDDDNDPTDRLSQAALRMAELMAQRPGAPVSALSADATYRALLKGSRRSFGIA